MSDLHRINPPVATEGCREQALKECNIPPSTSEKNAVAVAAASIGVITVAAFAENPPLAIAGGVGVIASGTVADILHSQRTKKIDDCVANKINANKLMTPQSPGM